MAGKSISVGQVQSSDRIINQLQQNIITAIGQLSNEFLNTPSNGIFLTTSLITGANILNHSLQQVPMGWIITDINANSTIYRTAWTSSTITLNASSPATINLFLF